MEAKKAGVWKEGKVKSRWSFDNVPRNKPRDLGFPFTLSNHPVVGIMWYEALAFTRWLTEKWKNDNLLPDGFIVHLPSEAEWEKAARGGKQILKNPLVKPVSELVRVVIEDYVKDLIENPLPGRINPWGDSQDSNKANIKGSKIETTNAVGCFPSGASPYGCEEVVGNAWEWTRNLYKDYPYVPDDGREDLKKVTIDSRIALRANAYYGDKSVCAVRYWNLPDDSVRSCACRVCRAASPYL